MSKYITLATSMAVGTIMRDASALALKAGAPMTVDHVNTAYAGWIEDYTKDCTAFFDEPDIELINSVMSAITLLCSNFKE